jgi:hypothetical protein
MCQLVLGGEHDPHRLPQTNKALRPSKYKKYLKRQDCCQGMEQG